MSASKPYARLARVAVAVVLFAFTTLLTWAYYGERCMIFLVERLVGVRQQIVTTVVVYAYRVLFTLVIFVGATTEANLIWAFSDLANGLKAEAVSPGRLTRIDEVEPPYCAP